MDAPRSRFDWTWPLIALWLIALVLVVAEVVGLFSGSRRFWDVGRSWNGQPYVLVFGPPRAGGHAERAGIHEGDELDIRKQSVGTRLANTYGLPGSTPTTLIVRRDGRVLAIPLVGSTVWDGASNVKMLYAFLPAVTGLFFLGCTLLIVVRRASQQEARTLALILLCLVPSGTQFLGYFPFADLILYVGFATPLAALALLLAFSARFGARNGFRIFTDWVAYLTIATFATINAAFWYGLVSLRFDPLPFGYGLSLLASNALVIPPLVAVIAAVAATPKPDRARAGWLLLPLTIAISLSSPIGSLVSFAPSWILYAGFYIISGAILLLGALLVTYALLRRRVIDVGFVMSRTIVVAILSVIVVAAFILLEWALGTVLAGASHATGLVANATLALVLGLSMRYIHARVDLFVDSVMFRKRHEDERALRTFAKEATFVTDVDALFDLAIAKVRNHTNALGAALFVNGDGAYRNVRSYGNVPASAGENDPAILALKAWHEPLDPHKYQTALVGDLALPVVARGHLHGVLLFEPRESGEAFAPDEIEALAELANGIGSAYETLAGRTAETNATVAAISALLERRFGPLQ